MYLNDFKLSPDESRVHNLYEYCKTFYSGKIKHKINFYIKKFAGMDGSTYPAFTGLAAHSISNGGYISDRTPKTALV